MPNAAPASAVPPRSALAPSPAVTALIDAARAAERVGQRAAAREHFERALRALPDDVAQPEGAADAIVRDGQVRLWWGETPVDLFFDYAPIHETAERHRRTVRFARTRIPVLAPIELAIFKAMFDRTRDWADIEAMAAAGSLDADAVRAGLRGMLDPDDPRFARLDEALRRARA